MLMKQFRYFRDPLFMLTCLAYGINRWFIIPHMPSDGFFFRGHFNDLLLIPCALPPLLAIHRYMGWRKDISPTIGEIILHFVIWSIFFEIVGPRIFHKGTADSLDVLAYAIGGIMAWIVWNASRKQRLILKGREGNL